MRIYKVIVLLIIVMLLVSCESSSSSKTISSRSVVENLQEQEKIQKEINILTGKEKFDLDYADGAYLEDYTEDRKRLNKEAQVYYKDFFKEKLPEDFYFRVDLDLYYSLLRKARDESLTYVDIVKNYEEQIDEVKFYGFHFFEDGATRDEIIDGTQVAVFYLCVDRELSHRRTYHEATVFGFHEKLKGLVVDNIDTDMDTYEIVQLLNKSTDINDRYVVDSKNIVEKNLGEEFDLKEDLDRLRDIYNQDFMLVDIRGNKSYFAPIDNPYLQFEATSNEDTYLSVLTSDWIIKRCNPILEKHGVENKMAFFVAMPEGPETILRNPYQLDYSDFRKSANTFTTLYYLVDNEDEIDYDLLYKIRKEIDSIAIYEDGLTWLYMVPIIMGEENAKTFTSLLRDNYMMESYIRDTTLGSEMIIIRNNLEPFQYLDIYGEGVGFMFRDSLSLDESLSIEDYFKKKKARNKYEKWRE